MILAACEPSPRVEEHVIAPPSPRQDYSEPIGPEPEIVHQHHVGEIKKRDSLSSALSRQHVSAAEIDELAAALKGVLDVRTCRPGQVFELKKDEAGRLSWFKYTVGPAAIAIAFRGSDGRMRAYLDPVKVATERTVVDGRVEGSLYEAMSQAGEQPALTLSFVDLFAWDIDFFTETQEGDRFRMIVEKRYVDGKLIGYGPILAAEYQMAAGKKHRAFAFTHADGRIGYYTDGGSSVRKAFLKSPIQFASITSRYGLRKHPILNYVSAHRGVDYGAPMGTAVWAVGDGVVRNAGPSGGYGNMVAIRHANGFETRYAHLRAFGNGVHVGKRVSQKQVIGYVGSTGLSTGPHLHFEVLRSGQWTNPLRVVVPPAPPVPQDERAAFEAAIKPFLQTLDIQEAHATL
jgi:murein DD-endopeptidase MepM/ murein hydrolase activator NlpD